jgi:hypothetical protein
MKFLDIRLTKDSSLLIHAIKSAFYWRVLRKTILYSGFKKSIKQIRETKRLRSVNEKHFVEWKNEGRKPNKDSSLCTETSTKYYVHEFHLH